MTLLISFPGGRAALGVYVYGRGIRLLQAVVVVAGEFALGDAHPHAVGEDHGRAGAAEGDVFPLNAHAPVHHQILDGGVLDQRAWTFVLVYQSV